MGRNQAIPRWWPTLPLTVPLWLCSPQERQVKISTTELQQVMQRCFMSFSPSLCVFSSCLVNKEHSLSKKRSSSLEPPGPSLRQSWTRDNLLKRGDFFLRAKWGVWQADGVGCLCRLEAPGSGLCRGPPGSNHVSAHHRLSDEAGLTVSCNHQFYHPCMGVITTATPKAWLEIRMGDQ